MHTANCACRICYTARAALLQAAWGESVPTIRRQILGIMQDVWTVYVPEVYQGMQN